MKIGLSLGINSLRSVYQASFVVSITGLTDGEARPGDHASISYTTTPVSATETVKWSDSVNPADPATYGTGANPTDFTAGDGGSLWLHVTDNGGTVSRSAAIRYAPGTLSIADQSAWTVDDTNVNLDASASGANLTFSYAVSGLPAGLSIDAGTGAITGTPTASEAGIATVTATDQYGRTLQDTFAWSAVLRAQATAAGALADQTWTVDDDTVNLDLTGDFTANGNTLTYAITGLPAGLSDDGDGSISGTPTAAASGAIVITATDEYGRTTPSGFSFTTSLRAQATGGADLDLSFPEGSAISSTNLIANWTTNGNTLTFVSVSPALPAGLSISSAGAMTGTPTTVTADATYTLTMQDEYGRATSDTFTLEVVAANQPSPSGLVSDNFNSGPLGSAWRLEGPAEVSVGFGTNGTDAYLTLTTPAGIYEPWQTNTAARVMQNAADTDFQIEALFLSTPAQQFQNQGFLVEQDAQNWLRFDTYSDGNTLYAFVGVTVNGVTTVGLQSAIPGNVAPYLRVTRSSDDWTFAYSTDGVNWTTAGTQTHALAVSAAGLFSGNSASAPGYTSQVDYFQAS